MHPTPVSEPRPARRYLLPAIVAVLTLAVFVPSLQGEFLNWDDDTNYLYNKNYRGLRPENLRWMFTDYFGHYMPLTWLTLGLDYTLWGMSPTGYHATSMALHALNAVLLFLLLQALLGRARPDLAEERRDLAAAAGALFFSLHPLRVESVAWITERRDVVSGAFFLLSLLAYVRRTREPDRRRWLWLSLAAYAGMILSKAMGMTLPLVLLALDLYPLRRFASEKPAALLREKIPFFLLMIVAVAATSIGQHKAAAMYAREQYPLIQSIAQPGYRISFYVLKTILPFNLSPLYWYRPEIGLPQALGWLAVIATTALLILRRHALPAAGIAWASYLVLVAPVAGVFQAGPHFAADRYSYFACLPFAALFAGGVLLLPRRLGLVAAPVLVALAFLSARQCLIWKDSLTLWNYTVSLDPGIYFSLNNRGASRMERGDPDGAMEDYNASIALNPNWAKSRYNRAVAIATRGNHEAAIAEFTAVVQLDPKHLEGFTGRALSRSKRGDPAGGLADCDAAMRIDPKSATPYSVRGIIRYDHGDPRGAIADYTRALELDATTPDVYKNRGLALVKLGRIPEAVADYSRSLELRPGHGETRLNRALARSLAGDLKGALEDFNEAIRLSPDPTAYVRRAAARGMAGDLDGAIADCSEAIRLNPAYADAYARRGVARAERGDRPGAAEDLRKALELAPAGWPQRRQTEQFLERVRGQ